MGFNIALVGGGTAGHIMPNFALIPELKKRFDRIIYIGSAASMEEHLCREANIPFYPTETMKYNRTNPLKNISLPLAIGKGVKEAKKILREQDISLVFSKGGYASVPTVLAAHKLFVPIVCHESDYSMGLANKFTARYAARIYTAFPGTYKGATILPTPIREKIFYGKPLDVFKEKSKPTLLFMGGSLGAKAINDALSENFATLSDKYNILHITGKEGIALKTPSYFSKPFTDSIEDWFATADLVVSRAGASTLSELTALGKRVLAIPLPKGESRGDQEENAAYYLSKGAISVLPQDRLSDQNLASVIDDMIMRRPPAPAYDKNTPRILAEELIAICLRRQLRRADSTDLSHPFPNA